jgi:hypothetical protein
MLGGQTVPLEKGSSREVVSRNIAKAGKTKDGILNWAGGNRTMSPTVAGGKTLDPKANANRTTTAVDTTLNAGHHRQAVTPAVRRSAMDINIARANDADLDGKSPVKGAEGGASSHKQLERKVAKAQGLSRSEAREQLRKESEKSQDADLISEDEWSDEAREKAAESRKGKKEQNPNKISQGGGSKPRKEIAERIKSVKREYGSGAAKYEHETALRHEAGEEGTEE